MAKFSGKKGSYTAPGIITTTGAATTHEGGKGFTLDERGELSSLTTSAFPAEDSFYEKASEKLERFIHLIRKAAIEDFGWLSEMLVWARSDGFVRTAPVIGAVEAVIARVEAGELFGNRALIAAVPQRADEPREMVGWLRHRYGSEGAKRTLKRVAPLRRGIGDAICRLWNQKSVLKWDSTQTEVRFATVLQLANTSRTRRKKDKVLDDLLNWIMDDRFQDDPEIPESLTVLRARKDFMAMPVEERRPFLLQEGAPQQLARAGMTWEALSGWLNGPMDAKAWEAVIPTMGPMALLRNLRNFDEAGISKKSAQLVCSKISDPEQVAKARLLPVRMLSAYRAAPSLRWATALDEAMTLATSNVPSLGGRTLVLVDTSASMRNPVSAKSTVRCLDHAVLFGSSLALKGESVDLVLFASDSELHRVQRGGSVLTEIQAIDAKVGSIGHGTNLNSAMWKYYKGHDRVVILSDMQAAFTGRQTAYRYYMHVHTDSVVPDKVPVYAFKLDGYSTTAVESNGKSRRYQLGGMTDKTFALIQQMEMRAAGKWPWEQDS